MKRKGAGAHNPSRIYELFRRPYVYSVLVIFILYLAIVFIIGNFPTTIPLALLYAPLQTRIELLLSLLFSITIAALVACNVVLAYLKYQERKRCHAASAVTGVGTLGGFAAGLCPVCISGLLPIIFGFFGVSFTFAVLPFKGLELQVLVIVLLTFNYWYLRRK